MKQRRKKERTWAEAARLVRARTARGAPAGRGGAEGPVPGRVCVCVLGGGSSAQGPAPSPRAVRARRSSGPGLITPTVRGCGRAPGPALCSGTRAEW